MSELVGDGDLEAPVEATDAAAALLERADPSDSTKCAGDGFNDMIYVDD